jgi:hypothetical protein
MGCGIIAPDHHFQEWAETMAEKKTTIHRFDRILVEILLLLGLLVLLLAVVWLILPHAMGNMEIVLIEGLCGLAAASLFFLALSALLRLSIKRVEQAEETQHTLELLRLQLADTSTRSTSSAPVISAAPTPSVPVVLKEEKHETTDASRHQMLELLQQIRDVSLMNDSQLQQVAVRHWAKRKEHLRLKVERHMLSGDWPTAKARLEELQALLPDDVEVKQLAERISEEHAVRLDEDLKVARAQLKQLYKINAWQEAEEIVLGLEHKYPHDREVAELTREVENKKDAVEREIREHLLSNVTEATGKHDWARGVAALEEFLHRFPTDSLADRLRVDLLTLRENAGAQERKEQEALFKELLKQHEYEKADNLAKSLIEKYPASSTAAELAKLLPKVEELMHQEKLKRQAVDATPHGGLN